MENVQNARRKELVKFTVSKIKAVNLDSCWEALVVSIFAHHHVVEISGRPRIVVIHKGKKFHKAYMWLFNAAS